ncbi:MAG: VOC family protein [SAR202 cluster bacterium]|nr:VOC family protein [SAR202 cluster bacterium]
MAVTMYHTGFVVSDLDRSVKFYTEGLGLECEQTAMLGGEGIEQVVGYPNAKVRAAFMFADDGQMLELLQYMEPKVEVRDANEQRRRNVAGAAHLGFMVDDVHAAYERLVKLGAKPLNRPAQVRAGLQGAYMQDPDGNWFEIVQDEVHKVRPFTIRQNRVRPPKQA